MNYQYSSKLVISAIVLISSIFTPATLAEYVPPADREAPVYTKLGGTRDSEGCDGTAEIPLTLFAPQFHIGETTSSGPTVAWFSPEKQSILEFQLFELDSNGDTIEMEEEERKIITMKSSLGMMSLDLSQEDEKFQLEPDKTYLWQVAGLCNPNRPSEDIIASARIKITSNISTSLKADLANTTEPFQRAQLYAQEGLWYDALREALRGEEDLSLGEVGANLLTELANLEEQEIAGITMEPIERLQIQESIENLREIARLTADEHR